MIDVYDEVKAERDRQDAKWGEQKHHPFEWLVILSEEVGNGSSYKSAAINSIYCR